LEKWKKNQNAQVKEGLVLRSGIEEVTDEPKGGTSFRRLLTRLMNAVCVSSVQYTRCHLSGPSALCLRNTKQCSVERDAQRTNTRNR
jgi:hypothetical protein